MPAREGDGDVTAEAVADEVDAVHAGIGAHGGDRVRVVHQPVFPIRRSVAQTMTGEVDDDRSMPAKPRMPGDAAEDGPAEAAHAMEEDPGGVTAR